MLSLLDERLAGPNATKDSRDEWANEAWPRIKLIWIFLILLHFNALIPLDPVIVHWLSVLLRSISDTASPVVTVPDHQNF
ncbi:hypothetical protein EJ03DRAFT_19809 [Teratosphaeria nubilosa]|uniref:Uncharacterized protein n=1 Tax=Teratosphaeria nubilosa TaxID=161662 RepID=A0A6G1LG51_9PEZI|nr:hypothetical protein EJ03DRAFT_19809 [Teratosphaeria nubilosa]